MPKKVLYSQEIARKSGSNFYLSFFFLPQEKKEGMFAVYAFSRLVDDAVDDAPNGEQAKKELTEWRARLDRCYSLDELNTSDHPLISELRTVIRRFDIPKKYFEDLITGMEMDYTKTRYETFDELEDYCYHVAGTVGLMCNQIFGAISEDAKRGAILLGKAFQVTNILRDVGKDAEMGRIYLPREDMEKFGVTEKDILEGKSSESFLRLMSFEADRAEALFVAAFKIIPPDDLKKMKSALVMNAVYHQILQKLKKENFPVFSKKMSLSFFEKIFHILPVLL